ncbi:MAG TPA: tyrosine-type recombinase/integrase [Candidatus Methanoperedens sp.]|nr:tyrosine-type recombinase/integrase [Candidatus Methanoperedens sp.]HLB70000.1 tyrosine-type recombinase/integrase [Candidatus Methanoperedens sp.]
MSNEFARLKRLDPVNKKYLEDYVRQLELKQLKPNTVKIKLWKVYTFMIYTNFKDSKNVTKDDVENYVINRRNNCSPFTVQGDILELKLFLRWLMPDREMELFTFKMKKPKKTLPVDKLITRNDIQTLVKACNTPRDRALIMLLWDSAARLNEIMNLNLNQVEFDKYGAVIIVDGKTGRRRLRLTDSVPDLQAWVNIHPMKDIPDAPLFLTYNRYGMGTKRLNFRTVENRLKNLAANLKMTKNIHPHAIRHARLTDLVKSEGNKKGFSEMELRILAGWEKNSSMPEVYVHLSGGDVERKILSNAGLIEETDAERKSNELEAKKCPRCKTLNAYDAKYCCSCSFVLDARTAREIDDKNKIVPEVFAAMQKDPEFLKMFSEAIAKAVKS